MSKLVDDAENTLDAAQQLVLDAIASRQVAELSALPGAARRLSADFL